MQLKLTQIIMNLELRKDIRLSNMEKTFYQEFKYLCPYSEAVSVPIRVTGTITVTSGPKIISYSLSAYIDNPGVEAYFISNPYFYQSGSHIYMTYNIRARCGFATQDSELQTVMVY